jgi:hypothetical protein
VFNVLYVGYSLAKNNLNNTYQYNMIRKSFSKTMNYVIGKRLIAESGDSKSKKFLFERISLAIQRGNVASIRGTCPDSAILSEIFVL